MSAPSLPGFVRGTLNIAELAPCLSGAASWEATFREARRGACKGMHLARLPAGTLIALVPDTIYAREVICTVTPVGDEMVKCFSLKFENCEWQVRPQILPGDCFERSILIEIEPTDWLHAASILMLGLRQSKETWKPAMVMWEIVSAWPSWQRNTLTWIERVDDLAERPDGSDMTANTLMVKCRRIGLVR